MQIQTIILQNVSHFFNSTATKRLTILDNESIRFEKGRMYAITGHSGVGKSTVLHILGGLETPSAGTVLVNDHSWAQMTDAQRARIRSNSLGIILQQPYLLPDLTVLENCMIKGLIAQLPVADCMARAHELLALVGLAAHAEARLYTLSGGQQQRLAIARALYGKPDFILADEPTSHLDAHTKEGVIALLVHAVKQVGAGLIINTHDEAIFSCMDQVYTLHNGHLTATSDTRKHHEHPQICS
ncbi:MAG: ABC transporter ATP-binding protein [Candidatus Babeliales bacterium]